jgi:hypothetical protein
MKPEETGRIPEDVTAPRTAPEGLACLMEMALIQAVPNQQTSRPIHYGRNLVVTGD